MTDDPRPGSRNRPALIDDLAVACELEHGLALQYLFTAASLKDDTTEGGVTDAELYYVRQWKSTLYFIAAQEMQHLVQAGNLIAAAGGVVQLSRPNFPQESHYYPMELPWGLWPFSLATAHLYRDWEEPADRPPPFGGKAHLAELLHLPGAGVAKGRLELPHAHDHLPARLRQPLRARASRHLTIGELYNGIRQGFEALANPIIGDPGRQVDRYDSAFPQVRRIRTLGDVRLAIELIVEQGEGRLPDQESRELVDVRDSHFGLFVAMGREYERLKRERPDFEPARDVAANPLSRLHPDITWPYFRLIENPYTRAVNDLNSSVYATLLMLLARFFEPVGHRERRRLASAFLPLMTTAIKPLCELLTTLDMGEHEPDRPQKAGPSFELGRALQLTSNGPAWQYIVERLEADAAAAAALAAQAPDARVRDGLAGVGRRLERIGDGLRGQGDTVMMNLPPVPKGQEIFFYASQISLWVFYRVPRQVLDEAVGERLAGLGMTPATFRDHPQHAIVALNPMFYTAAFDNGLAGISEVEFNVVAYPAWRRSQVPQLTLEEFLLGWEQEKLIGQFRLDVLCDNLAAVSGGRQKYGEHKFLGQINFLINPLPNTNMRSGQPVTLKFEAYQCASEASCAGPLSEDRLIFALDATTGDILPADSAFSDVIVYGTLPPEPQGEFRLVGSRRNHLGLFRLYLPSPDRPATVKIRYGQCAGGPPLVIDNQAIPGSGAWPQQMRELMQQILPKGEVAALLLFETPPVEIEPRPFYADEG